MGKTDDKGEPVKTVTIGGKEVEVPIIFILPEEAGEKEIERYEHPEVHIKKEDKAAESEEEPLEELTDGKLEEVEKPPFAVPKKKFLNYSDEEIVEEDGKTTTRKKKKPKLLKGYSDEVKEGGFSQQQAPEEEEENTPYFDLLSDKPKKKKKKEDVSYRALFDKGYGKAQALARWYEQNKPKKEKEYLTDEEGDEIEKSWRKWLEKQAPKDLERGAESNVPKERMEGQHIGDAGFITEWSQSPEEAGQSHGTQSTEERKRSQREDEHKDQVPRWRYEFPLHDPRVRKAWEKWLENKSLGALGWGKLNRDGTKKKLRRRQPTLDDYPEDDNGDKKDET